MYQIQEVLIPARFILFVLQGLLSICVCISREDNIKAQIGMTDMDSKEYSKENKIFLVCIILFFVFELVELGILLSGLTLFNNKLSVAQIFFHSVAVLLLNWFNHEVWGSRSIWTEWAIGGIVPVVLELCGLMTVSITYRKVSKVT